MSIPINKSLETIRTEIFDHIKDVQEDYIKKGWLPKRLNLNKGIIRGLIEIWSWGLFQLYSFLGFVLKQAIPVTATSDDWMDIHANQVEITRKLATKAEGFVILTGEEAGNIPIKKGRIFKTLPDGEGKVYRFIATEDVVLKTGETEISVPIIAEEYGMASNVVAGTITEISTTIDGISSVKNEADWLTKEGSDKEDNESLFERYVLRWQDNNGLTKYAYESWALGVSGVTSVKILDQHPRGQGTIDVVVKGSAGLPTQSLLDEVEKVISENEAINDDVKITSPDPVHIDIDAEIELVEGIPETIIETAKKRIEAIFKDPSYFEGIEPIQIGEDLTLDMLISTVRYTSEIKKINWSSPSGDTQITGNELAVLRSLNLTWKWADER